MSKRKPNAERVAPGKPGAKPPRRSHDKAEPALTATRSRSNHFGRASLGHDGTKRIERSTRDRILAVATKEFSAKGYDGARVDAIMRQSKVSKNLIYHYFQNKEKLFVAVLESSYERIHQFQTEWTSSSSSPTEGVLVLIRLIFKHWRDSPEFMGLLNSENFYKGRHLRQAKGIKPGYAAVIAHLQQIVKEGERSGQFRKNIDPVELYISISSLSYHYFSNRYTLLYLLGREVRFEEHTQSFLAHIEEIILNYVHAPQKERPLRRTMAGIAPRPLKKRESIKKSRGSVICAS